MFKLLRIIAVFSIWASLLFAMQIPVNAQTVNIGGGIWNYGQRVNDLTSNYGWSKYYHAKKVHKSTVRLNCYSEFMLIDSGWVRAGKWSTADQYGTRGSKAIATWKTK